MDFKMTEEQELLLESLKELVEREWNEEAYNDCYYRDHTYPLDFISKLSEAGFTMLGVPEEYGGTPVDYLTLVMFAKELARLTGASLPTSSNAISIDDILSFGNEEQKKFILEYVTEHGTSPFALGFSEPQAGSDSSAITTTATRKDGKVYINGHKTMVSDADTSPYLLTITRDLEAEKPMKAMSMWLVPMDAPGVKLEPLHKIGLKTSGFHEIYLENVEIEESALIGIEGEGFMQLMKNFEIERLMLVAIGVGMAEAAFEEVARYANFREQFGKPIGQFQIIQEKITDMAIKIANMKSHIFECAWKKDNDISIMVESALAKRYCSQASFEVLDEAMQILGGIGYTEESRISRMWVDVRHLRIAGGTDEIMVHIAGRQLLKQYR
ncbi:MAG TPA: acyl-CoA dehydrogenase [Coriobacteriia bacterium]|nr:acyl-CoA dehydrogenase [Coriobacteriia bacterium]